VRVVISDFGEAIECAEVRDSEEWASSRSLYCSRRVPRALCKVGSSASDFRMGQSSSH
jgi:hypothetical protein